MSSTDNTITAEGFQLNLLLGRYQEEVRKNVELETQVQFLLQENQKLRNYMRETKDEQSIEDQDS